MDNVAQAKAILRSTLPVIRSHDDAIDHLYYLNPYSSTHLRLLSIAAALYILDEAGVPYTKEDLRWPS